MKPLITLAVAALAAVALLGADAADAKRLGGGRSFGMQRPGVTAAPSVPAPSAAARAGAAANPVMPATPGAASAARPVPNAAASGAPRWLGPIAGLAAGLGLAALLSHFGLSEGLAGFLLLALLVVAGIAVVRTLASRRSTPQAAALRYGSALGGSAPHTASQRFQPASVITPPGAPMAFDTPWNPAPAARRMPAGFEPAAFLEQARLQFRRLQDAHDRGDREALANVTTPAMYREIVRDLDERKAQAPTEIVTLDANLLDVAEQGSRYVASIRFEGSLREDGARDAAPFVEIWNLEKPVNGSTGWLLAGIQQTEDVT